MISFKKMKDEMLLFLSIFHTETPFFRTFKYIFAVYTTRTSYNTVNNPNFFFCVLKKIKEKKYCCIWHFSIPKHLFFRTFKYIFPIHITRAPYNTAHLTSIHHPVNMNTQSQGFHPPRFPQVRVADDRDFERLKKLCDCPEGWTLAYENSPTRIYTRPLKNSTFHMIKVV